MDNSRHSIENTRKLLREQFPNLDWQESKGNRDQHHVFVANFLGWWRISVEVFPIGCRAIFFAGNSIMLSSPNEQDCSLESVVADIRNGWDEIAQFMSHKPKTEEKNNAETI